MAKVGCRASRLSAAVGVCLRVPAIMATRTIENKRDRTATILIAPS